MIELLESTRVVELAKEKSVRGEVARLALEQAAEASLEEKEILASALQELLDCFSGQVGDQP